MLEWEGTGCCRGGNAEVRSFGKIKGCKQCVALAPHVLDGREQVAAGGQCRRVRSFGERKGCKLCVERRGCLGREQVAAGGTVQESEELKKKSKRSCSCAHVREQIRRSMQLGFHRSVCGADGWMWTGDNKKAHGSVTG